MKAQPCQLCGHPTFAADGVCLPCTPLTSHATGTYPCCGGFGEHFSDCTVGDDIARARAQVAAQQVRRPLADAAREGRRHLWRVA